jgi:F-type H+-transporting ATPase subunit epsilon
VADTFPLEITTPSRVLYSGEVEMVRAPGTAGSFQVFPGHMPLVSTLEIGELDIREPGQDERVVALSTGFIEVLRGGVSVLVESAELPDEIDLKRAEEAAERARERLHPSTESVDRLRADMALQRAMNRIRIARRTTI